MWRIETLSFYGSVSIVFFYGCCQLNSSHTTLHPMNKTLLIVNYAARGLVLLIGIVWVSGFLPGIGDDTNLRMFGLVFILFGLYRLATFYTQQMDYQRQLRDEED